MKNKKVYAIIITIISGCLFLTWLVPFMRNEILTIMHGKEFEGRHIDIGYYAEDSKVETYKVISYSKDKAEVYYVHEDNSAGNIVDFVKNSNGEWELSSFNTVWSSSGSASEILWPYFWHVIYGGL